MTERDLIITVSSKRPFNSIHYNWCGKVKQVKRRWTVHRKKYNTNASCVLPSFSILRMQEDVHYGAVVQNFLYLDKFKKVKVTLKYVIKAQRGGRDIGLPTHNLGSRREWMVNASPRPP